MKKTTKFYGMEFTTNNQREEDTLNILNTKISTCLNDYDCNTFGDNTMSITRRELSNINGVLSCLYYMGICKEPYCDLDIKGVKERGILGY